MFKERGDWRLFWAPSGKPKYLRILLTVIRPITHISKHVKVASSTALAGKRLNVLMLGVCHSEFLSYNNCTEKKTKTLVLFFFGSSDLGMVLIANAPAMCDTSDTSVVQTCIPRSKFSTLNFFSICLFYIFQ